MSDNIFIHFSYKVAYMIILAKQNPLQNSQHCKYSVVAKKDHEINH